MNPNNPVPKSFKNHFATYLIAGIFAHETGPIYLAWVAVDDTLRGWRYDAAKERDGWRREWASYVSLEDSDVVWRKRASARRRARELVSLEDELGSGGYR